jgi:tRNA A37 methylthiotransferase MiaB
MVPSVTDLRDAEVVVVNTCGFIDAAKQESTIAIPRPRAQGRRYLPPSSRSAA